jgi:Family of unknown function (DUF6483)
MIERDYIMRMIQMLVQVLAKILFFKKGGQYPKALDEIQKASKQILGIELEIFRKLSDLQMIDFLSLDVSLGIPKCYAAGMLLKEEAEILDLQGKAAESIDARLKSLILLTEAAIEKGNPLDSDHASAVDGVAGKLNEVDLPVHIHKKLFRYYELVREFGKAEDALFEILEKEPSFIEEGMLFYERLKKKSDKELTEGNLLRKEIEESLKELQGRK